MLIVTPIWTPGLVRPASPKLKRFLECFLHLKKDAATGHLLKNSAGHLVNDCGEVVLCVKCDTILADTSPSSWSVVSTGITLCTDCCTFGGTQSFQVSGTAPNGTYDAPFYQETDEECIWRLDTTGGPTVRRYSDTGCTTETANSSALRVTVTIDFNDSTFSVTIGSDLIANFYAKSVTLTACDEEYASLSNQFTLCPFDPGGGGFSSCDAGRGGKSGSVTATPQF